MKDEYKGAKLLWLHTTPAMKLMMKRKPVRSLEDLKGLKIAVSGDVGVKVAKAQGFAPVTMPTCDIYVAQDKGVIDVSPYRATRAEARKIVGENFIEVYMDTPVEVCEQRDVNGLSAKARQAMQDGKPMGFIGVDDPYEPPINPEITLRGYGATPEENAYIIINYLEDQGYLQKN